MLFALRHECAIQDYAMWLRGVAYTADRHFNVIHCMAQQHNMFVRMLERVAMSSGCGLLTEGARSGGGVEGLSTPRSQVMFARLQIVLTLLTLSEVQALRQQ